MEVGDALVTVLATCLTGLLGGVVGPIVAGFVKRLWAGWKRDKALVDAGAEQQRQAERAAAEEAAADAGRIKDDVAKTSPGDVSSELSGWLQPRR